MGRQNSGDIKMKIIKIPKAKHIRNGHIVLYFQFEKKCQHDQKIVFFKDVPMIVRKNYWDFILDVMLNRGV